MKKQRTRTSKMQDLLLPIVLVVGVLPLVVHLAVYSCGYSMYDWYYENDVVADFYCYYKSYVLDLIAFFSFVILVFRYFLYREKIKKMRTLIPLFLYCVPVILSTIFSVNQKASLQGNFESFESCFVLISYVVLFVYTYQIVESEQDLKLIWNVILWLFGVFCVIGSFQIAGHDLFDFTWMQRLIMSAEHFAAYGGEIENTMSEHQVYLTLYNPNYAGTALGMLFAIVFVMFVTQDEKRGKIVYGTGSVFLAVLIWFTYSRASVLILLMTVFLTIGWLHLMHFGDVNNERRKYWKMLFLGAAAVFSLLVVADALQGFHFLSRFLEKNEREPLESIITDEEGIHMNYDKADYLLFLADGQAVCRNGRNGEVTAAPEGEQLKLPFGENGSAVYRKADENMLLVYLMDTTLIFVEQEDGYYYQNAAGRLNRMTKIEKTDLHGLEYFGSARGYIWSRVFPLLSKYLLIGSGPDTFAEVFPQNDYAGKIVYADDPDRVIEKAHNDFLMKWVQTGLLSVICMVVFYVLFIVKCHTGYRQLIQNECGTRQFPMRLRLGLGCYLSCISFIAASFVNDSTLQTSPLFWIFAGIALSCVEWS